MPEWIDTATERYSIFSNLCSLNPPESLLHFSLIPSWFWSDLNLDRQSLPMEFMNQIIINPDQLITLSNTIKMQDKLPMAISWQQALTLLSDASSLLNKINIKRFIFVNLNNSELINFHAYLQKSSDEYDTLLLNCLKLRLLLRERGTRLDFRANKLKSITRTTLLFHSLDFFSEYYHILDLDPETLETVIQLGDEESILTAYAKSMVLNLME